VSATAGATHKWEFKARFRRHAFGWRSQPAVQRIKQAVSEIKKVVRRDPVLAAEGAVTLLERISPALEQVASSSGAIGTAVNNAICRRAPGLREDDHARHGWEATGIVYVQCRCRARRCAATLAALRQSGGGGEGLVRALALRAAAHVSALPALMAGSQAATIWRSSSIEIAGLLAWAVPIVRRCRTSTAPRTPLESRRTSARTGGYSSIGWTSTGPSNTITNKQDVPSAGACRIASPAGK
jgi:hypothetical protein